MRAAVDLHMHSCLSPCGDEMMTPNNIVNMCMLKELDIIAVTDHNAAGNLPAIAELARRVGLGILPGIEANTAEEVHMLCYFPEVEACMEFSRAIYEYLPDIPNRPQFFGEQLLLDIDDEVVGEEPKLLISALTLSIDQLAEKCVQHGGICVPAHINRTSNALLANLGFVPPGVPFAAMEVYRDLPAPTEKQLAGYRVLHSSDAHRLFDIFEREEFIDGLQAMSGRSLFRLLKGVDNHA